MSRGRRVVVRAGGHPLLRATHTKTLELTTEADVTARATCVVAIAPPGAFGALTGLRGPVTVTLRAGGFADRVTAVANPAFDGGSRAVIRRSGRRSPETLAVEADRAAADLDRGLARALAEVEAEVEVVVEAAGAPPHATAALLVVPRRLAVAPPAEVVRVVRSTCAVVDGQRGGPDAQALARRAGVALALAPRGEVLEWLGRGEAVALVCDLDHPGEEAARLAGEAAGAGVAVRAVPGAEPAGAALVACGLAGVPRALLGLPPGAAGARGRQLRAVAALGAAGVWEGPPPRLLPLLRDLAAWRPRAPAALLADPGGYEEALLAGTATEVAGQVAASVGGQAPALPAGTGAVAVADLRAGADPGLDGELAGVLDALLDEGVAPRTLARALQRLPGIGRRRAYEAVLERRRERE